MFMWQPVPDMLSFACNHNITQTRSAPVQLSHADRHRDGQTLRCKHSLYEDIANAHIKDEGTFVCVYVMTA
jgi:hypothetical protein